MNIFVLDEDPHIAARMLCDCHTRKMILETAQILSAVMIIKGMELQEGMPKPQNTKHPVITAVNTPEKINWVLSYGMSLLEEYTSRFHKQHAYHDVIPAYVLELWNPCDYSCEGLAKCCGDMDTSGMSVVDAYRQYYIKKKQTLQAKGLWKFTNRKDWTDVN